MMEHGFAGTLERYLGETLHARIRVKPFETVSSLPSFLARSYKLYETRIAGRRCVFVAAGEAAGKPGDIAKHVALIRSGVKDAVVVFAAPSLSAHNRSRLLGQGIAFVVPGNQLYIPELAMDLREHFRAPRSRTVDGLSPAAQAVLFLHLLRRDEGATTPSAIAERQRYSAMSIGRAFDELAAAGLAETEKRGKERHLRFRGDGRALLEDARDLLRSPVRAVKFICDGHIGPILKRAGESALAELTDLSPPRIDTYAVAAGDWKAVAENSGFVETDEYDAGFIVETWSYDPAGLSDDPVVDPLSLFAQFKDHGDERVAMAAERLLEKALW
jgi:hypothetical protein